MKKETKETLMGLALAHIGNLFLTTILILKFKYGLPI
jgi:hypothetical protein